ncbi:hypothetical protein QQ045_008408 [Rhodiola kirilowii]
MWIRWMHTYFFNNQTLWEVAEKNHHSWVLKNILRLRQDAQRCIQVDDNLIYSLAHNNTHFSAKGAYEVLKEAEEVVTWTELVWNGVSHPKHSFCTWLAIQKKLYTRDRIWGLVEDQRNCKFCNSELESVDHVFFLCRGLIPLHKYLEIVGIHTHWNKWEDLIQWQHNMQWRSKEEKMAVFFIITLATYETWKARNYKIF